MTESDTLAFPELDSPRRSQEGREEGEEVGRRERKGGGPGEEVGRRGRKWGGGGGKWGGSR